MITLKNVTLRRGTKVVLDSVSTTINPGENVGLVGRNGAGKSSLFALLSGKLHEDGGDFHIPSSWRMAEVAQNMPETDQSATDFVLERELALDVGDLQGAQAALEAITEGLQLLRRFPFTCRKVGASPFLRELVIPFGHAGYVALFEIVNQTTVVVAAVRHQRESDFH